MKQRFTIGFILLFTLNLQAQISLNGYLRTYNRFRVEQDNKLSWNDNMLGLKFQGSPSDNIHYYSEVRLRGFGFSQIQQSADLQRREKDLVQPWCLE